MLFMEIYKVGYKEHAQYHNRPRGKNAELIFYTRYHAAYITPVAATAIYKGLIQLPCVFCRSSLLHLYCVNAGV